MKITSLIAAAAIVFALSAPAQQVFSAPTIASGQFGQPTINEPAPAFTGVDTHGQKHSLSDFAGKTVVLEWVNFGCPFVGKHYGTGNMQKLQKEYTGKGVIWLTICSSAAGKQGNYLASDANKVIAEKHAAPTFYLLDADGVIGHLYGAKSTPTMCVIDKDGGLKYYGAIDDKATTDAADVTTAKPYFKEALDQVLAGQTVTMPYSKAYGCSVKY
jgi:hypothetical protein